MEEEEAAFAGCLGLAFLFVLAGAGSGGEGPVLTVTDNGGAEFGIARVILRLCEGMGLEFIRDEGVISEALLPSCPSIWRPTFLFGLF